MTLVNIRNKVRDYISQEDTSNTDFSDTELNNYINEGIRYLGKLVKKPIKRITIQAVLDTATYSLASVAPDFILPTTAYFGDTTINGDVQKLELIPEESLAEINPAWLDATTGSQGRPRYLVMINRTTVLVHPRPNSDQSASGKLIHLTFVYEPTEITSDSAEPDLPISYHDLIPKYAYSECLISKLKEDAKGYSIRGLMEKEAKKIEPLIIKEANSFGFTWGHSIDVNDDSGWGVRVS